MSTSESSEDFEMPTEPPPEKVTHLKGVLAGRTPAQKARAQTNQIRRKVQQKIAATLQTQHQTAERERRQTKAEQKWEQRQVKRETATPFLPRLLFNKPQYRKQAA